MFDLMNTRIGALLNTARTIKFAEVWMAVFRDQKLKDQVLNWIKQDQLFNQGIDENGNIIGTYSPVTEMINPLKEAGSHYTLFDTGEFYDSMMVVVLQDSIIIEADPIKVDEEGQTTNLFNEYGEGIIGLTDENKTKLAQELVGRFITEYRRLLSIN